MLSAGHFNKFSVPDRINPPHQAGEGRIYTLYRLRELTGIYWNDGVEEMVISPYYLRFFCVTGVK